MTFVEAMPIVSPIKDLGAGHPRVSLNLWLEMTRLAQGCQIEITFITKPQITEAFSDKGLRHYCKGWLGLFGQAASLSVASPSSPRSISSVTSGSYFGGSSLVSFAKPALPSFSI